MRKNTASQIVSFQAISTTDGSDVTSGSPAVYYTIDGGTQATGSGTTTHEGNGQWSYAPAQAETNGNHVAFTFVLSGAVSQTVNVYPVAFDPTDAADLGVTALTGHTPQTGDSFARLGAPAGASISADIATVDGVVDSVLVDTGTTLPATLSTMEGKIDTVDGVADSILVDTNELQTDWANGGRLDLILDARASQASVDTVDSNVDAILVDTADMQPKLGTFSNLGSGSTLADNLADMAGSTFSNTTDSLEAIRDRGDSAWATGGGSGGLTALASGTAQSGTSSTVQLASSETFADDILNGCVVNITGGTGAGQSRVITDYAGSTDTATVTPNWTTTPDNTSTYEVVNGSVNISAVSSIAEDIATATNLATVDSNVDSILVDTGTTLPATLSTIEGKIDTVDGVADAILVDTNELQTDWADGGRLDAILDARASQTSVDTIDGIVDSILDDTGTSGVVLAAGSVTASVIATDAIDADALAADAVGEIADGVWDEAKSGHNVAGSFGKAVRQIQEGIISDESTVNDASATTTNFVTALTETTDDYYNQKVITFIDGNLSGQSRVISDYNGTTKTITVDEAFTEAPANGDGLIVLAFHQHTITEIKTEVRSEIDSNSTKLASIEGDTQDLQTQIGTAGAGLTDLGGMSTGMKAEVNAEADTALTDYDAPTKAEMDSAFATTDALITTVDGVVDGIVITLGVAGAGLTDLGGMSTGMKAEVNAEADTALADYDAPTKAEMDSAFATTDALITTVDGVVDSILLDTAEIGAAGAGLTAVPYNSAWDAEIQSEVTDALNAYDPPTKTEMDSAFSTTDSLVTTVDGVVDGIATTLGTAGAGLTDLGGMSTAMKAEVNAEALDVLQTDTPVAGQTIVESLRRIGTIASGKVSNAGTGTETFTPWDNGSQTIVITVDSSGNRSGVTYN